VDVVIEAVFAEGGIVARQANHRFGFTLGTVHDQKHSAISSQHSAVKMKFLAEG
jgi:hypothetical protein